MTLQQTKKAIFDIVESARDYQQSINSLQTELISMADQVHKKISHIANDIDSNAIVDYCDKNATRITSSIINTFDLTKDALSELSRDATEKIKKLVDEYNNSLDENSKEERLSYIVVNLSSVSGDIKNYSNNNRGNSNSNISENNSNGSNNSLESKDKIDEYLALLSNKNASSDNISDWDETVNKFLAENKLDSYFSEIELDGDVVKCTLVNNVKYKISNIADKQDFLNKIKAVIKKGIIK